VTFEPGSPLWIAAVAACAGIVRGGYLWLAGRLYFAIDALVSRIKQAHRARRPGYRCETAHLLPSDAGDLRSRSERFGHRLLPSPGVESSHPPQLSQRLELVRRLAADAVLGESGGVGRLRRYCLPGGRYLLRPDRISLGRLGSRQVLQQLADATLSTPADVGRKQTSTLRPKKRLSTAIGVAPVASPSETLQLACAGRILANMTSGRRGRADHAQAHR